MNKSEVRDVDLEKRVEELEKKVAALEVQAQEQLVKNYSITINTSKIKTLDEVQSDLRESLSRMACKL